jgi:hypothetical protein
MAHVPVAARTARYSSERLPLLKESNTDPATGKKRKRLPGGPFSDLTWTQQRAAEQWYWKFCLKWGNDLPAWRRGILIGVARRLAITPLTSARARSVWNARCGHANHRAAQRAGVLGFGIIATQGCRAR